MKKLTVIVAGLGWHLLERRSVEYVINARHRIGDRLRVAHIAHKKLDLSGGFRVFCLKLVAHIVLLFLIAGENADLSDVRIQETSQYRVSEGSCSACDQ